jgi:glutamate N-acetyltransferase/amino-acid N-acetyltransferase
VARAEWLLAPPELVRVPDGTVTEPSGFEAAGAACGVKPSGDLDVGILVSRRRAVSALVDTRSALPSAPVVRNRGLDLSGLQAVVVNAGTANASTGSPGLEDAAWMAERAAARLGLPAGEVAVSSTGTIGPRIDRVMVGKGIEDAAGGLSARGGGDFNKAIQTTDGFTKGGAFRLALSSGTVAIGVAAKGAGMISPDMATMLAYVTTDACIDAGALAVAVRAAAEESFNRITVDGQMSPSDTLLVFANGEGTPLSSPDLSLFSRALTAVCRWIALQMVKDGEGAEHCVRLLVTGGRTGEEADAVARAIGNSPLVKAAVFGRDPNWGRVAQAVGHALAGRGGDARDPELRFDGVDVDDPGVAEVMARPEYEMGVALGRGGATAELFFCDLTHAYVSLNAEYTT